MTRYFPSTTGVAFTCSDAITFRAWLIVSASPLDIFSTIFACCSGSNYESRIKSLVLSASGVSFTMTRTSGVIFAVLPIRSVFISLRNP